MQGIDLIFKFGESLFDEQWRIESFITCMRKMHPEWVTGLGIVKGPRNVIDIRELQPSRVASTVLSAALERGHTFAALQSRLGAPPSPRRLGSVELKGSQSSITAVWSLDDHVFQKIGENSLWGNSLALQFRGSLCKRRGNFSALAVEFWSLCKDLRPIYAYACALDESDAKNMDYTHGVRAVGQNISKYFPGIYWQNYFRSDLVEKIWNVFPTLPDCTKKFVVDGLGFGLGENPYSWNAPSQLQCESEVRAALGSKLFFDRTDTEMDGTSQMANLVFRCKSSDLI